MCSWALVLLGDFNHTRNLNLQRADFDLFTDLPRGIPCDRALEEKGIQESLFRHHFLQAQDQCIPMTNKSSKGGRRPAQMSRELLANFEQKK